MGPPVLRRAGDRSGGAMKLDLLWVFEDGREVWASSDETTFERVCGHWGEMWVDRRDCDGHLIYTQAGEDLEAAREEALRPITGQTERLRSEWEPVPILLSVGPEGVRKAAFDEWGDAHIAIEGPGVPTYWKRTTQAAAFRWLFMGRLG